MYDYVGTAGWQSSPVYDLASWKNGLAFRNIDFSDAGRPIIKIGELKNGVTEQTARTMAEYDPSVFVRAGDMLFSWSGNPDTSIDVFRWEREDGWLNQHIFKVTPKQGISDDFLFFVLKWLRPRFAEIARNKQTTGLGHVTVQDLKRMMVGVPDLHEQDAIVSILRPLQSKIDLNLRINETLETMGRAIFKNWFVDFGPTRAKIEGSVPYLAPDTWALFPDRLDDDGKPKTWKSETVLVQANWINGAAYKNMHFVEPTLGLPVVKIAELKNGVTSQTKFTNTDLGDKYRIKDGEILFSWSGNPDTSIDTFIWTGGPAWLNQHIFAVRENGHRKLAYVYAMLKWLNPVFAELARNKQTTGLGHVTKEDLGRLQVVVPPPPIELEFDRIVGPILDRLRAALFENRALAATRDALLPKLMSGEIRVKDAEKIVEAVL
jgi:type I restriction enzyme, S subunit